MCKLILPALLAILSLGAGWSLQSLDAFPRDPAAETSTTNGAAAMAKAARQFLEALGDKRNQAWLGFEDENRKQWHFVPGDRQGLSLAEMDEAQRKLCFTLLETALSEQGYRKAEGVIALEAILGELEGRPAARNPNRYWIAIFGNPEPQGAWGWRFEGHHLSLNVTAVRGEIAVATPSFLGSNPAEVPRGERSGWRLLAAEEDLARSLLRSLNPEQRRQAVIADRAPRDILMQPDRNEGPERAGLSWKAMNSSQKVLLRKLIDSYVRNTRPWLAKPFFEKLEAGAIEAVRFAWMGSDQPGEGHYYRVHGKEFVLEYDNVQNGANHVHTVWRDLNNDFGRDLLREHYAQEHSQQD